VVWCGVVWSGVAWDIKYNILQYMLYLVQMLLNNANCPIN